MRIQPTPEWKVVEESLFSHSSELQVFNGKIAGYDYGEYGGKISFIPDSGTEYKLINENFKGFYSSGGRVFVLTGLSNMFTDKGHIYEVIHSDDKWRAVPAIDLESCPESHLTVDGILYVATNKALIVVETGAVTNTIPIDESYVGLYPNSMVWADSKLYIGVNGGMISVGLEDRKITLYSL